MFIKSKVIKKINNLLGGFMTKKLLLILCMSMLIVVGGCNSTSNTETEEVKNENYAYTLSTQTEGFANADLAKLVNDAALIAKKDKKETIDIESLRKAFTRTIAGLPMEHELSKEDQKIVAYHEAE